MSDDPDAIRADIEATRRELSGNVDALADKVTPSKIAHRQSEKAKAAVRSVTDRVMGASDSAAEIGSTVGDAVSDAGRLVAGKAQGNPLAVGLIAFGIGWLAASLAPASRVERQIAANVADAAQPLVHEATAVGKQIVEDLKEPVQDAVDAVTASATDAAQTVKEEATEAAQTVKGEAVHTAQDVSTDTLEAKHVAGGDEAGS